MIYALLGHMRKDPLIVIATDSLAFYCGWLADHKSLLLSAKTLQRVGDCKLVWQSPTNPAH